MWPKRDCNSSTKMNGRNGAGKYENLWKKGTRVNEKGKTIQKGRY